MRTPAKTFTTSASVLAAIFVLVACRMVQDISISPVELGIELPEPEGVTLYWSSPLKREDGTALTVDEIGGYEIRYWKTGAEMHYQSVIIHDGTVDQYSFESLMEGQYEFRIAAFDTDGLYSDFITGQ